MVRKLLNVLYVTSPDSYLAREGENVVVRVENKDTFRMPIHNLEGIVCFNYTGVSPALMGLCVERGVALSFLNESGRFYARIIGEVNGNVLLRRKQYRIADVQHECMPLARNFIIAKISNSRSILQRALRDHESEDNREDLTRAVTLLGVQLLKIDKANDLEAIRGIEGESAHIYFSCFNHLITAQKEAFSFYDRNRRPPRDNVNAMLSFIYTLLMHDIIAALESVGIDPYVGFLHRDRPGRPSLALDMMEELRAYLGDRMVLTLINKQQVKESGFLRKESGAVIMDDETRKTIITAWQKRKQEEIIHPFLEEKIPVGLIPYVQALLLARYLRGDIDAYPPFFIK